MVGARFSLRDRSLRPLEQRLLDTGCGRACGGMPSHARDLFRRGEA